jgi:hypothetical protein
MIKQSKIFAMTQLRPYFGLMTMEAEADVTVGGG